MNAVKRRFETITLVDIFGDGCAVYMSRNEAREHLAINRMPGLAAILAQKPRHSAFVVFTGQNSCQLRMLPLPQNTIQAMKESPALVKHVFCDQSTRRAMGLPSMLRVSEHVRGSGSRLTLAPDVLAAFLPYRS